MYKVSITNSIKWVTTPRATDSFNQAKADFRTTIKKAVSKKGVRLYLKMINTYCREVYPRRQVPQAFKDLKVFLVNYITKPNYFPDPKNFTFDVFEDENVIFGRKPNADHIFLRIKNKDKGKSFPEGTIPIVMHDGPKTWCYFLLEDGYLSYSDGKKYETRIRLEYDNSYDKYDFEEDEDEEYDDDYDEEDDDEEEYEEEHETPRSYSNRGSYSSSSSYSAPVLPPQKKPLARWELAELRSARNHYEKMASESARYKNTPNAYLHEAAEKRALAELMRIEAKYAGRQ